MPNKPNHTPSFDLTLLPPAQQQFTILSDTHYMLDCGDAPLEFASRRKQSQRAGAALHRPESTQYFGVGGAIGDFPNILNFVRYNLILSTLGLFTLIKAIMKKPYITMTVLLKYERS